MATSQASIGLEVDDESLRAVIVRRGMGGRSVLVDAREWSLPRDATERTVKLAEALGALRAKAGISAPAWVHTLQGANVALRLLQVPVVPRGELKGAVTWEARTQVPFPLDRAFVDYAVLGEIERDGGGRQLLVMFAAAAEEVVLARLEPFKTAGIHLANLTHTAAALWNGRSALASLPAAEPYVLVHAGEHGATVCVAKGNTLSFTREIALAGGPLATMGSGDGEQPSLVRELRRTLHHYQERHGGERVTTVVLSGTTGCASGVAEVLSRLVGCSVVLADPLGRLTGATASEHGRSPAFGLAVAAALSGGGVNLLPPHLRPRAALPWKRLLVPAAAAIVLAAGSYQWWLMSSEPRLRVAVEKSETQLARLKSRQAELDNLKARRQRLERVAAQMPQAQDESVAWNRLFQRVAMGLPPNVSLRQLAFASGDPGEGGRDAPRMKASLNGVAFGTESEGLVALASVIESLQATRAFGAVKVSAPIRKNKDYNKPAAEFGLTFDVVP